MKIPIPIGRRKPYYGWVIVGALATVGAVSMSMGGINFGLFLTPMSEELDIKQAFFGWAQTARLIGFAAGGFIVGRILDRFGARVPLLIAGALVTLTIVGLSFVNAGWQIVALFFMLGLIGMQGAGGSLYTSVPISRWFVRKRGKAMSAVFMGAPIGIFIFAPLSEYLISEYGWRTAWFVLGCMGGTVVVIVAAFVVRRSPEDMGLLPDGEPAPDETPDTAADAPKPVAEYSWTRYQALRSKTYWLLALIFGMRMFTQGTLGLFRIPFYIEKGIDPTIVALSLSAEAVAAAVVAFPVGWALDRIPARFVAVVPFLSMGAAFLITMNISETWHVFAATMIYGVGAASFAVIQNTMWPQYFGPANIGSIRGSALPITIAFSAAGAPIAGMYKDAYGTFVPIWWASLIGLAIGLIFIVLTPRPRAPG